MAQVLGALIGSEFVAVSESAMAAELGELVVQDLVGVDEWEDHLQQTILEKHELAETLKFQLIKARQGQGIYRKRVTVIEKECRITHVNNPAHLIASHCKPWRDADDAERLDGENGLLLTPSIDHLFDRGFISFENNGSLLVSPVAHQPSLNRMGIDTTCSVNVGGFSSGQKSYLEYHRNSVFLQKR